MHVFDVRTSFVSAWRSKASPFDAPPNKRRLRRRRMIVEAVGWGIRNMERDLRGVAGSCRCIGMLLLDVEEELESESSQDVGCMEEVEVAIVEVGAASGCCTCICIPACV